MKGVSKTVIAFSIDGGLGVLIRIFFYRISTPSDYGYIGFLVTTAYFFAVFSLLGADYALIYSLASERRYRSVLSLVLILPLIGVAGDVLITRSIESALLAYLSALSFVGAASLVGRRMYDELIALMIVKRSIQIACMIYLYELLGAQGAVLGIALSMIPGILVLFQLILETGLAIELGAVKQVASLSGAAFLLSSSLYVDKIVLGKIMSYEEFSGYYLAFQAILVFNAVADATMKASTSEYIAQGSIDRFSKAFIAIIVALSPIAAYYIAPFAPLVLGESAKQYVRLIALTGLYLPAAVPLSFAIARMASRDMKRELIAIATLLLILRALMPPLMLPLGAEGALMGFILATLISGIAALAILRR